MLTTDQLIGHWRGTETISSTAWGPVGSAEGSMRFTSGPGPDLLLQEHTSVRDEAVWFSGHGVLSGDPWRLWWWFDSTGHRPDHPAKVISVDSGLRLVRRGATGRFEHTWLVAGASLVHRIDIWTPVSGLVPMFEATYRRV